MTVQSTVQSSAIDIADPRGTQWFWSGAAICFVVTGFLRLITGQLPDLEAITLGLFTSVASIWAFYQLQVERPLMNMAALVAMIVMLLCLLATGSWQLVALPMYGAVGWQLALPSSLLAPSARHPRFQKQPDWSFHYSPYACFT